MHLLRSTQPARVSRGVGWLGMDVGSGAVKIAQVERTRWGWSLRRARVITVPAGGSPWEVAVNALRSIVSWRTRLWGKSVAVVSSLDAEIRNLELPDLPDDQLQQHLAGQMGAAAQRRLFTVWRSSWLPSEQDQVPCHLLATAVEPTLDLANELLKFGAECEVWDIHPFCLSRLPALGDHSDVETHAVFDWAYENALLTIVHQGQPYFTRKLRNCGYRALLEACADKTGLREDEVTAVLRRLGERSNRRDPQQGMSKVLHSALARPLESVIQEISRTLIFLGNEDRASVPQQIYLVGGGASVPLIAEQFSAQLQVPSAVWSLHKRGAHTSHAQPAAHHLLASAISLSAIPLLS